MPRNYDEDDVDDLPVRKKEMGPLDGIFRDTSMVVLVCSHVAATASRSYSE